MTLTAAGGRAGLPKRRGHSLAALLGLALASAGPVLAAEPAAPISLRPGRLADALQELSVKTRTGVLFSPDVVGERRSAGLAGTMTLEQTLGRLLDGTGLTYRRTSAGTYIIYPAPTPVAVPEPPVTLPELLVVGRRTQNADIRRTENDIQPYQVFSSSQLGAAQVDNIGQFLHARMTNNADLQGPSLDPAAQYGANRSEANLHGLGASQTLILVDGARMPAVPNVAALEMNQPDINGIPVLAIDRIETLTATAGGIYGPGATGGVVNVILRRDYRGADLAFTYGVADRGDGARRRIDGRIGLTPDHGRTDIMFTFSRSESDALSQGQRDYAVRARELQIARDPKGFVAAYNTADAILIQSIGGGNLTLSRALGGASLGSSFTYLPIGRSGDATDLASVLLANAGKVPSALARDAGGTDLSLTAETKVTSLLFNVRRKFGDHVEAFVDLLGYQNDGRATFSGLIPNSTVVSIVDPTSPFGQSVSIMFPASGVESSGRTRLRTYRLSAGVLARLPFDWKADATYSVGGVRASRIASGYLLDEFGGASAPLPPGTVRPPLKVLGDWATFVQTLPAYSAPVSIGFDSRERFYDASLRLAGPLWSTPAGPVNLTLLAEHRLEVVPTYYQTISYPILTSTTPGRGFSQSIASLYGELRAPLLERSIGPRLLRGLELQLAARYDDNRTRVPSRTGDWLKASQSAPAYTAGLRVYPHDRLMLRGSVSTGVLPPTPAQLLPESSLISTTYGGPDPKRGGRELGSEGAYTLLSYGSLSLKPEKATALSFGMVFNPDGGTWPRVSIDYTRIAKSNEIIRDLSARPAYVLANETLFADRVTRAPLTDADRAAGFTGGVITRIDASYFNIGRTRSDAVDVKADYARSLGDLGRLQVYAAATWQPRLIRRISPDRPALDYAGFAEGPLRWRANLGATWDRGPVSVSANGQYYGPYNAILFPQTVAPSVLTEEELQRPGVRTRAQFYLDLSAAYLFTLREGPVRAVEARVGVQNLFDSSPPIVINTPLGYSFYGDPRRRRIEVSLRARF